MALNKVERELLAKARKLGVQRARIVPGGRHPKLKGWFEGRPVFKVIPKTPSDHRSLKNWLAELKRGLGICNRRAEMKHGSKRTGKSRPKPRCARRNAEVLSLRPTDTKGPRPRLADDPWAVLASLRDQLILE